MAFAEFQARQQQNKQKAAVREFFLKRKGQLLCLSDDPDFISLLRFTIKDLALPQSESLILISSPSSTLKTITDAYAGGKKPALFIEHSMSNTGETSFLIRQFKQSFPELRIFVMTTSSEKGRIMLLYESGADNFVVKPVGSSMELIDKMAATLRAPGVIQMILDKARSFIADKLPNQAITITRKVLDVKPDNAPGYVVMGDALRLSGKPEKAKIAYEYACKYSEDYIEPLQKLADLAEEKHRPGMQLEYLKRLDAISPFNAHRKLQMGELELSLGHMDAAKHLFDGAVDCAYKDAITHVTAMAEKIAASLQESDPAQAEKYLRRCLEMKGWDLTADDLSTFNLLGISLRKQGRWEDAITEYKKALRIAPDSDVLFYNLAMAHAGNRDSDNAISAMQKAYSINPGLPHTSAATAYNMGYVFSFAYTKEKAVLCLEIALQQQPDLEVARNLLDKLQGRERERRKNKFKSTGYINPCCFVGPTEKETPRLCRGVSIYFDLPRQEKDFRGKPLKHTGSKPPTRRVNPLRRAR